jgi:uncharacterized protein
MTPHPDSSFSTVSPQARDGLARLREGLGRHGRVVVGYSGGIDSTFLLWAALGRLGRDRVLGVTGISPSLADAQLEEAVRQAREIGAPHRLIRTAEVEDPAYLANAPDRCYHCKSELYERLVELARAEGFDRVLDGSNLDDTHDVRPGFRAIRELGVESPLLAAGLGKDVIRELSRAAGLRAWDRPASPCLSSRVPHGTPITLETLARIDKGEEFLRAFVRGPVRLRTRGRDARIEVDLAEVPALLAPGTREAVEEGLRALGYESVTIDPAGYRQGGANVAPPTRAGRSSSAG